MPAANLLATFRHFCESEIEFIVVGSAAATIHGAPNQTMEAELVYSREPANIDRIVASLDFLEAVFRMQPERRLRPRRDHVAAGGHLNLITRFGPLDLLGTIGLNLGYADLLPQSTEMNIGEGYRVRVLNLETIISIKEQLGSEKDLAVLPILRRTLSEKSHPST